MSQRRTCPDRLVEHFKSMPNAAAALSEACRQANPRVKKLSKQAVHKWVNQGYIPEMYALPVERATGETIGAMEVLREAEKARRQLAEER